MLGERGTVCCLVARGEDAVIRELSEEEGSDTYHSRVCVTFARNLRVIAVFVKVEKSKSLSNDFLKRSS